MAQNLRGLTDVVERYFVREREDILEVPNNIFNTSRFVERIPRSIDYLRAIRILELNKAISETCVLSIPEDCAVIDAWPRQLTDLLKKKWQSVNISPQVISDVCGEVADEMASYYLGEIYSVNPEMDASEPIATRNNFEFVKRLVSRGIESVYDSSEGREKFADFLLDYDSASQSAELFFNWIKNVEEIGRRVESIHFINIAYRMANIFHEYVPTWSNDKKIKCLELITDTVDYSIWLFPANRKIIFPLFYSGIDL